MTGAGDNLKKLNAKIKRQPRRKWAWTVAEEIIGQLNKFNRIINRHPWLGADFAHYRSIHQTSSIGFLSLDSTRRSVYLSGIHMGV
ncbi:hypothetical protein TOT_020000828 [Theileria orientalis strain Shintoku]|uniref:Uncharacterized protein n=1 Tax=Theileria orientalis strain Shintoku TaxID=869250 RepID=J4C8D0_THEOR|nr:hypothetical protein TOT_020000828 [Theileria orientalis strain Shintoku]PVC51710.1 hypothetical protein MACL_00001343 [Theileria orientalis]BAM40573.1 hypothetical protein TOT_020000828 [Theileria orientalis strain Shintoku]|eukprot:XP_009690874.1 hypothetical protein TOT_020000828 [Theileria orientalis strain Shintoku]